MGSSGNQPGRKPTKRVWRLQKENSQRVKTGTQVTPQKRAGAEIQRVVSKENNGEMSQKRARTLELGGKVDDTASMRKVEVEASAGQKGKQESRTT
ncbi:unnamed protein product [Linum trigynum]|uniref:Uncharacterized protein n=1 Tax=Linum trigynum TaxID=586398 RepID=A0AAV2DMU0_9ROSI